MRSSTLLALFVCIVFFSSGFRTVYGDDDIPADIPVEDEEKHVSSKGDEGLVEAPPESHEPAETLPVASGEQEVKGNLQVDPEGRNELVESVEVGEVGADKGKSDVEHVPEEPETQELPDRARSGNLDTLYGKQSLCIVAGKNCVCRSW